MILTKKEIAQRLMKGEKLYATKHSCKHYCYYNECKPNPFRYLNLEDNIDTSMDTIWDKTEWEVYEEGPVWWEPKEDENAYYISITGEPCRFVNSSTYNNVVAQGNVFKTKEEIDEEAKLRAAKYRVKRRIWELNGGCFINLKENDRKHSFDMCNMDIIYSYWSLKFYPNWQYLKSKEVTEQLIEEMYNDLLLIREE